MDNLLQKISFNGLMLGEVLLNIDPECEGKVAVYLPKLMYDNTFHENPYENDESIDDVLNTSNGSASVSIINECFNKSQTVDPTIKQVNYFWVRPTYLFESGLAEDTWDDYGNPDATQNSGNYKVPRIGSKVFIFFLDGDPQKGFYLPFSPSIPLQRIGDKEASRNWVRQFEVDDMLEKLKTYDNNTEFNKTDLLNRLAKDLQEVINSVGLYNQPNKDYSNEEDGEYKSFLARAARQVNIDVLRSYYNGCRLEVDTNKNDECIILSAGGPGYEKENGSSGVDGFGSDLAYDTFKDMEVEEIDVEMNDPPSDSYYAICPPIQQRAKKYKNSIRIYQDERGIVINGDVTINGNVKIRGKEDLQQDLNIGGDVYCIKFVENMEDYEIGDKTYELDSNGNKVIDKETNKYKIKKRTEVDPNKSLAIYWTRTVDPKLTEYGGTEQHQENKVITINTPENAMFHNDVSVFDRVYTHRFCTENYMFNGLKYTEDGNTIDPTIYKNKDNPYVNNLTYRDKIEIMKFEKIGSRYDDRTFADHYDDNSKYFNNYNAPEGHTSAVANEDRVDRVKLDAFNNVWGDFNYTLIHEDRVRMTLNTDIKINNRMKQNIVSIDENNTYMKNDVNIDRSLNVGHSLYTGGDVNFGDGMLVSDEYIKNPCLLKEYVLDTTMPFDWESWGTYPDQLKNHDGSSIKAMKEILASEDGRLGSWNLAMYKMQYQFNIIYSFGITKPDVALHMADCMNQFGSYHSGIWAILAALGPSGTLDDAYQMSLGLGFGTRRHDVYCSIKCMRDCGYLDEMTGPDRIGLTLMPEAANYGPYLFQEAKGCVHEPTLPHILLNDLKLINRNITNAFYRQSEYTDALEGEKRYHSILSEAEVLDLKNRNLLEEFPDSLARVAVFITDYFENGRGSEPEMSGDPTAGCSLLHGIWGNAGNHGSVTPLDVNAITVSVIGFHGEAVRVLLHLIYEMNPEQFETICSKYNDEYKGAIFHTNLPSFQLSNSHDDDYEVNDDTWQEYRTSLDHSNYNLIKYMRDNNHKDTDYTSGYYYPYEKDDFASSCYNFQLQDTDEYFDSPLTAPSVEIEINGTKQVIKIDSNDSKYGTSSQRYMDSIPNDEKFNNSQMSDWYKSKLEYYLNSKYKGNILFKSDGKISIESYNDSNSEGSSDAYISFSSKVLFYNDVYIGGKNEGTNYDRYNIRLGADGDIQTRGSFAIKTPIHDRESLTENATSNTENEINYINTPLLDNGIDGLKTYELVYREYDTDKESTVVLNWDGSAFVNQQSALKLGKYNKSYMRIEIFTLSQVIELIKQQTLHDLDDTNDETTIDYTLNEEKINNYLNSNISCDIGEDFKVLVFRVPYLNYDGTAKTNEFYYKFYSLDNFIFRKLIDNSDENNPEYETLDTTKIKHFILDIDKSEIVHSNNDSITYDVEDEIMYEIPIFDGNLNLQDSDNYLFKVDNFGNTETNNIEISNFNKFELYNPSSEDEYYNTNDMNNPKYINYNNNILFSIQSNEMKYRKTETLIRTFKTKFKGAYLYSYDDHTNGIENYVTFFNFYHNSKNNKPEKAYMPDLDLYVIDKNFVVTSGLEKNGNIINVDNIKTSNNTFGITVCDAFVNKDLQSEKGSEVQEQRLLDINVNSKLTAIYYPNVIMTNREYMDSTTDKNQYNKFELEPKNGNFTLVSDYIDIYSDNNSKKSEHISSKFTNLKSWFDLYDNGTHKVTLHGNEGKVGIVGSFYTGLGIVEGYITKICSIIGHDDNGDGIFRIDNASNEKHDSNIVMYQGQIFANKGLYICDLVDNSDTNTITTSNDIAVAIERDNSKGYVYTRGDILATNAIYTTDDNFNNWTVKLSNDNNSIISKKNIIGYQDLIIDNNAQIKGLIGCDYMMDVDFKSYRIYTGKGNNNVSVDFYVDNILKYDHTNGVDLYGSDCINVHGNTCINGNLYMNGDEYLNTHNIYNVGRMNIDSIGNNGRGILRFDTSTDYQYNSIKNISELYLTNLYSHYSYLDTIYSWNNTYTYVDDLYSRKIHASERLWSDGGVEGDWMKSSNKIEAQEVQVGVRVIFGWDYNFSIYWDSHKTQYSCTLDGYPYYFSPLMV